MAKIKAQHVAREHKTPGPSTRKASDLGTGINVNDVNCAALCSTVPSLIGEMPPVGRNSVNSYRSERVHLPRGWIHQDSFGIHAECVCANARLLVILCPASIKVARAHSPGLIDRGAAQV